MESKTLKLSLDDRFNEFLTDYLDGSLDKVEHQVFNEYLEQAESERLFVQEVKKGKKALNSLPEVKASNDFEDKLAKRIALEKELSLIEAS